MSRYGWTTTSHGSWVQSKFKLAQWEGKSSLGQDWRQTCSRNRVAPGSWCTTMVLALQHRSVLWTVTIVSQQGVEPMPTSVRLSLARFGLLLWFLRGASAD